jgi:hypothetical protein
MATTQQAHGLLKQFCDVNKREVGIAFSVELLQKALVRQLSPGIRRSFTLKSTTTIEGCVSDFKFSIAPTTPMITRDQSSASPKFNVVGLGISVDVILDSKEVFSAKLTWNDLSMALSVKGYSIQCSVAKQLSSLTDIDEKWSTSNEAASELKTFFQQNHGFTLDTWSRLSGEIKAALRFASPMIARTIVSAIELPDFAEAFVGFVFEGPMRIGGTDALTLLAAPARLNFDQCAVVRAKGELKPKTSATANQQPHTIGDEFSHDRTVGVVNPIELVVDSKVESEYPKIGLDHAEPLSELASGHLFLYMPSVLLRESLLLESHVKPALEISKKENWGPFFFRYVIHASPRESHSVDVSLSMNSNLVEFKLSIPAKVTGEAGAGIEIACIVYEAIGARFKGSLDPCDFYFQLRYVSERRELVFVSKASIKCSLQFDAGTSIGFPLDQIIDVVLARAAENLIESEGEKFLTMTRIPIAELGSFAAFGAITENYATSSDTNGDSTFGIQLAL